jgi:hypothetical protein
MDAFKKPNQLFKKNCSSISEAILLFLDPNQHPDSESGNYISSESGSNPDRGSDSHNGCIIKKPKELRYSIKNIFLSFSEAILIFLDPKQHPKSESTIPESGFNSDRIHSTGHMHS